MKKLSIIVPCFNEEKTIPVFHAKISDVMKIFINKLEYEIIFIDDGSSDNTLDIFKEYNKLDKKVKFISFSRNFGKEAAIYAGLESSVGDFVAIMDVDLQDPPEMLADMYKGIVEDGYDSVAARRVTRKGEPPIRSFFARKFYSIINKISKTEFIDGARDYRMMTRKMANAVLSVKEFNRFSKGIFSWVGFKTKWLEYENIERSAGETKWSFWKLLIYSLDGIVAFSTVPLSIASFVGVFFCIVSFVLVCFYFAKTLIWGDSVSGFPTLICVIMFLGGLQLFCIGILGQYLSKTYLETKRRPIYIIKEDEGFFDNKNN
jgi:Glycosyltransferases involved in cell wall biogenesis